MFDKDNKFALEKQGVSRKSCDEFIKMSYDCVVKGITNSLKEFRDDPHQYDYRSSKAVWMISQIKKLIYLGISNNSYLGRKIKHLKSYGSDYYLLEGKALICFKRMNRRSRVSGFNSKRFKAVMKGNLEKYSIQMLNNLAEMGIHKPLPIYYVGYVLDRLNNLSDVRIAHYQNNEVVYVESLRDRLDGDLFTVSSTPSEPPVTPKLIRKLKKTD